MPCAYQTTLTSDKIIPGLCTSDEFVMLEMKYDLIVGIHFVCNSFAFASAGSITLSAKLAIKSPAFWYR